MRNTVGRGEAPSWAARQGERRQRAPAGLDRRSLVVRAGFFTLVSFAASALIVHGIAEPDVSDVAPYFLVAIVLQLAPLVVRSPPDPFEPAAVSSAQNLMVLVPALVSYIAAGAVDIRLLPTVVGQTRVELLQSVAVMFIVATVAYYSGYCSRLGGAVARMLQRRGGREWEPGRLWIAAIACMAVFVPSYMYFQARAGGSLADVTMLGQGKAVWRHDPSMSWLPRAVTLGFVPTFFFAALYLERGQGRRALAAVAALLVIGFLTTRLGQRSPAVYCLVSVIILVHYLRRRVPLSLLAAFVFVVFVIANGLVAYRVAPAADGTTREAATFRLDPRLVLVEHENDRQRVAVIAVILHYFPAHRDFLMGESWLGLAFTFIPRALVPEKLVWSEWRDAAIISNLVEAPFPTPYVGVLYCNFSWPGVVCGMFLWGLYHRGLYEWLLERRADKEAVLIYSLFVIHVGPTMLHVSQTLQFVIPVYLVVLFVRRGQSVRKVLHGSPR